MATSKTGNGDAAKGNPEQSPPLQVHVAAQYIKDFSFENPNVDRLLDGPGDNPNLKLEVNVDANKMGDELYESAIHFKALATNKEGTIYEIELVYAGLFRVKNIPKDALEPFLLINAPSLIFPFVRRLVADISREGGFPPLLLDPVDFGSLYVQRQQSGAKPAAVQENVS